MRCSALSLWQYRTQANIEIHLIPESRQGQITGIEVKASAPGVQPRCAGRRVWPAGMAGGYGWR